MNNFVVGDIVILSRKTYIESESNPYWGGHYGYVKGIITGICGISRVYVRWNNGRTNSYSPNDLSVFPLSREHNYIKLLLKIID